MSCDLRGASLTINPDRFPDPVQDIADAGGEAYAVLGASNYTYAEATWTQSLLDWIGSHVRALEFFGSVPAPWWRTIYVAGVARAHRYGPDINAIYQHLAMHYGTAILRGCANRRTRRRPASR